MRINKLTSLASLAVGTLLLLPVATMAQELRSEISIQGTGSFTKESTEQGIRHTATDTGGVIGGYRYHINRWLSAEALYGWNRNTQEFTSALGTGRVQSDVHQVIGGAVINVPVSRKFMVKPYVLAEGGALIFRPTDAAGSMVGADQQARGAFVYGGGFDYPIPSLKRVALRVEYRGFVYKAPDFGQAQLKTDNWTHTAQPSAGLVYRF